MFFRGQLAIRLPSAALRLCCNAAPSTSTSTSYILPSCFVLSRCRSHVIAAQQLARQFGASLVWIRGGGAKDWQEAEEVKGARTKHTDEGTSSGGPEPIKPMGPNPPSKMKLFVVAALLSAAVTSLIFSTLMAESAVADSAIPADAPQVDFATFAKKYLSAGEIKKITYVVGKDKAVGTLHAGAIIDGKPASSGHIVINYPHPAQQFWADVRAEEAALGISLSQGVDLQLLNPVSGWRMIEFFIGCIILGWLCTAYGRLTLKKIAEERAKKAAK